MIYNLKNYKLGSDKSNARNFLYDYIKYAVIAFVYTLFVTSVSWEEISRGGFPDRLNYETYFSDIYLGYKDNSIVTLTDYLTQEWLWLEIVRLYLNRNLSINDLYTDIAWFSIFGVSFYLLLSTRNLISILLLVNPIFLDLVNSQLRSSLAITLFYMMIGLFKPNTNIDLAKFILVCVPILLIHTSMIVILIVFCLSWWLARRNLFAGISNEKKIAWMLLLVIFSLLSSELYKSILQYLNDRRSEYETVSQSWVYVSFWFLLACALIIDGWKRRDLKWFNFFSILICFIVPIYCVFGLPVFRFVAVSLPAVYQTLFSLDAEKRNIGLTLIALYQAVEFYYWV